GVLQLEWPPPADELRPRGDPVIYNEPESHLDQVADLLAALPGVSAASSLCGLSYKDDSTLRRMRQRGIPRAWSVNMREDLGLTAPEAGIESLQEHFTPAVAARLAAKNGRPSVLLVRHVLEHAHDI